MQINNLDSNPKFKGAFRFKPTEIKAQQEIPQLFTQGRQFFSNILEKGDMFVVVRDNYDKRIGNYIKENGIKNIEYYPLINTKSGLDSEKPEELLSLLKNKSSSYLTTIKEIFEIIAKQKKAKKTIKIDKELDKIINTLRLYIEKPIIYSSDELTHVRDNHKKRSLEIIALNKDIKYVYLKPDSLDQSPIRCVINRKGEIVKSFETPDEIMKFVKTFKRLKNEKTNKLVK